MVAPNKQRVLTKLLPLLPKPAAEYPKELTVLDHLLLGVLQEEAALEPALNAYRQLRTVFLDLNELRVSHPNELVDYLSEVPDSEVKARRILQILRFVFETTYTFDLESMRRKPLKQAQKQLSKINGATDYSVAAAVQRALGGHSIPIDNAMVAFLGSIELAEEGETVAQLRGTLEHLIPKAKGVAFSLGVSEIAHNPKLQSEVTSSVSGVAKPKAEKADKAKSEKPKVAKGTAPKSDAKPVPKAARPSKSAEKKTAKKSTGK